MDGLLVTGGLGLAVGNYIPRCPATAIHTNVGS